MNDIESRLREFRPRRPAAIPNERQRSLRGPLWRLAVAAGVAAAILIAARMLTLPAPQQAPAERATDITLGALTTMAVETPDEFDGALTRMSGRSLPDVRQPGGALQQLAKEY